MLSSIDLLLVSRSNKNNGKTGASYDPIGDAPEHQPSDPRAAVRAHDDQIGLLPFRCPDDAVDCVAEICHEIGRDALLNQTLCGRSEELSSARFHFFLHVCVKDGLCARVQGYGLSDSMEAGY